jgi:hypothetical protein
MPKFIFTYHQPKGHVPADDDKTLSVWQAYFAGIEAGVVDPGQPVFDRSAVGVVGDSTQLGGYSIVAADDLESALAMAKGSPIIANGGGVQVGTLAELPADHIVSRIRERAARS